MGTCFADCETEKSCKTAQQLLLVQGLSWNTVFFLKPCLEMKFVQPWGPFGHPQ